MRAAREAAALAGVSVSTLRRWECGWCGQNHLNALRYGCGAIYERCNPDEKLAARYAAASPALRQWRKERR